MVFYAFQQGQIDRRNAQRKYDLTDIGRSLEKFRAATTLSNGQYPATPTIFDSYFAPSGSNYNAANFALGFGSSAKDPLSQTFYNYDGSGGATGGPSATKPADITYQVGLPCGALSGNNPGVYRLTISLEGGSYCVDNH